ncbi:MAG: response regulator [Deltaproteobacteria bacterium]|nr:response regulator [Deltaproteobacteria bacterium]
MNLNALIVDDDTKLLTILKSLLTEEKLDVTTSDNGLDAINKCTEQQFDLIISDLMMPGASGLEVLKEARKVSPATLVILVTGFASLETAIEAIREGAYDYITKPFKLDEIKIVVNNAKEKIYLVRENERLFRELQDAYQQLHMVKKIMGAHQEDYMDGASPERILRTNEPLIAGSM